MYRWVTQITSEAKNEDEAREILNGSKLLDDYICGRIIAPSATKPTWRIQYFIELMPAEALPEGCKNVVLLNSHRSYYETKAA